MLHNGNVNLTGHCCKRTAREYVDPNFFVKSKTNIFKTTRRKLFKFEMDIHSACVYYMLK